MQERKVQSETLSKKWRKRRRIVKVGAILSRGGQECAFPSPYNPPPMPFIYILRCGDGSLYTGIAKDLDRRLAQHRAGRASRYTRSHLPGTLGWWREVLSWGLALPEERRIKKMRKTEKEMLLKEVQDSCPPLSS